MWELLAGNHTAVLSRHVRGRWITSYHWSKARGTHTPSHGLAITSRMRTAISRGQWQPWTPVFFQLFGAHQHGIAISQWLGKTRVYKTLSSRGKSFKCQLHTADVRAVGWEPHGSSPTTCAGKADHGFGVCVLLALIIWNPDFTQLIFRDIEVRVFAQSCARHLSHIKVRKINIQRTDLYLVSFKS